MYMHEPCWCKMRCRTGLHDCRATCIESMHGSEGPHAVATHQGPMIHRHEQVHG